MPERGGEHEAGSTAKSRSDTVRMEFIKEGTLHGLPPEDNQFRRAWSPTARCDGNAEGSALGAASCTMHSYLSSVSAGVTEQATRTHVTRQQCGIFFGG